MRQHPDDVKILDRAEKLFAASKKLARRGSSRAKSFILGRPMMSTLLGIGAGFILALLLRPRRSLRSRKEQPMFSWSLAFFIVAVFAAVFGFGGIASGAAEIARVCFFFFLVAFLASLIWSLVTGRRSGPPV